MALIEIKNFSFIYAGENTEALHNVSVAINEGEMIVLCGRTGCGKTTLLKQMKTEIAPIGIRVGHIYYNEMEIEKVHPRAMAKEIGMVFQDPENQIVTSTVWHELAFSLENFGYCANEIRKKVAEMATFFGIEDWLNLSIHSLSGGQKQIVNLASVLLLQPRLLLLDEPTAQLDPIAAREFLNILPRINQEFNTTVVIVEHRLEDVFPIVDRVILLENGQIKFDDNPQNVIKQIKQTEDYFHYLPEISKLFLFMNEDRLLTDVVPVTVRDGKKWLSTIANEIQSEEEISEFKEWNGHPIIECKDVFFQYERGQKLVLEGINYRLPTGMFAAIIGGNGAGKSTLLRMLAGLDTPQRGKVYLDGKQMMKIKTDQRYKKIGYLSQNPLALFTQDTVAEELKYRDGKINDEEYIQAVEESIDFFELRNVLDKHPYDLSGGERQKLALALILLKNPKLLLIDEPTKGLDPKFKQNIGLLLKHLQRKGLTILMVTHDIEFAAQYADHCSLLFKGTIVSEGTTNQMLSDNYFYTTAINRLVRNYIPQALNYEDVLKLWNVVNYY
ncbi:ABC transporter ATP-binding protein [Calidifontibacillus oryziterrae]|uniref:ABC transporter ATP-binding protein n=1 Tax=Calidifontibacillus oryziterrae TaxID=1191699 RepID=UPI0003078B26|nr:ABC transporter ATP-binding protein [Calidifontibacillus oryziterrae]